MPKITIEPDRIWLRSYLFLLRYTLLKDFVFCAYQAKVICLVIEIDLSGLSTGQEIVLK